MFKHLLVPLDGSRLAEAVLPTAAYLAHALHASVTLLHVVERRAPQEIHGERHLAGADEARAYLDEVAARAFPEGTRVMRHVHTAAESPGEPGGQASEVARHIAAHGEELRPDLIVMCTHGHGGLRAWLLGSIAQQVIALGQIPVLLIQPGNTGTAPRFACRGLLVPLDGDPEHEQGLPVAAGLAQACGQPLHLVMVVPTLATLRGEQAPAGRLLPGATTALLDLDEQQAAAYLRHAVAQTEALGVPVTAEVARGDPAAIIVRTARRLRTDLVVLGTHGKTGLNAFWSESVAPRVSGRLRVPLLLVPVGTGPAE